MKTKFILSLITVIFSGIFFLGSAYATSPDTSSEDKVSIENGTAQKQTDGEIIAVLIVVNKNEISAANEALKKASNPAVKKYAQMLKKAHTKNLKETLKLSKKNSSERNRSSKFS